MSKDMPAADPVVTEELKLAAEFPAAHREQWLKLVAETLKGGAFERLVAKTYDGIAIEPLYERAATARPVFGRPAGSPWRVMARIEHPNPAAANAQALQDLESGADGIVLVLAGSPGAYGFALPGDAASPARVLLGIKLDAGSEIELQPGPRAGEAAALAEAVRASGAAPAATKIRFGIDPISAFAIGAGPGVLEPEFGAAVRGLASQGFRGPFAAADGRVIHNAGGSEAQELAYVLAAAVAYLRALDAGGIALDEARRMIFFRLTADADQFATVAKFRALRLLWARVEEAGGLTALPAYVAAETAWRMMTRRESSVNMLRATVAVAAAGLGGADSVTVLPHTAAIGLPDEFARRLARNTQLILIEESNLAKVADPATGSGAIEALTRELCHTAWSLFQAIERAGGAVAALERGLIQEGVAKVRRERERAIARRTDALTGTSTFPDLDERPPVVLAPAPAATPEASAGTPTPAAGKIASPLACRRLAEPFEVLRDASDRYLETTGARPKIFLANLGWLGDFTQAATFAKNLFEAGGIEAVSEAVSNDGFATRNAMIAAFTASGAHLACLCGSAAVYAADAADAAKDLRAAGATYLWLAGRPGELAEPLRAAGVNAFVHSGCDVLDVLRSAHAAAGMAR
jgi:methylmalonyl-CoA mutase